MGDHPAFRSWNEPIRGYPGSHRYPGAPYYSVPPGYALYPGVSPPRYQPFHPQLAPVPHFHAQHTPPNDRPPISPPALVESHQTMASPHMHPHGPQFFPPSEAFRSEPPSLYSTTRWDAHAQSAHSANMSSPRVSYGAPLYHDSSRGSDPFVQHGTRRNPMTVVDHDRVPPVRLSAPLAETSLPRAPVSEHKVYILDCKHCGMFLTNRGMKAVLLLQPNVSLFSTDALPVNCSVVTDSPRPPIYGAGAVLSGASTPTFTSPAGRTTTLPNEQSPTSSHSPNPASVPSCECLTQTMCCHGCGTAVGYMIVIPCARCTSSTSSTKRGTNGHRFVFHSKEIQPSHRLYIQAELGVVPTVLPDVSSPPPAHIHDQASRLQEERAGIPGLRRHDQETYPVRSRASSIDSTTSMPALEHLDYGDSWDQQGGVTTRGRRAEAHIERLPNSPSATYLTSSSSLSATEETDLTLALRRSTAMGLDTLNGLDPQRSALSPHSPPYMPQSLPPPPQPPATIKDGDVLFWHNMARHGLIYGVQDDPRARSLEDRKKREREYNVVEPIAKSASTGKSSSRPFGTTKMSVGEAAFIGVDREQYPRSSPKVTAPVVVVKLKRFANC